MWLTFPGVALIVHLLCSYEINDDHRLRLGLLTIMYSLFIWCYYSYIEFMMFYVMLLAALRGYAALSIFV